MSETRIFARADVLNYLVSLVEMTFLKNSKNVLGYKAYP